MVSRYHLFSVAVRKKNIETNQSFDSWAWSELYLSAGPPDKLQKLSKMIVPGLFYDNFVFS